MIYAFSSCRHTSFSVTSSISCIDVHTDKSTGIPTPLAFILRPHVSLSLFCSWLCHDSQSAMNTQDLAHAVCKICPDACTEFSVTGIVRMLLHLCPLWLKTVCDLWWYVLNTKSSSDRASPAHAGAWVLLFLYCCTITQHYIGSYWQMQWVRSLHCLALHYICSLGHPSSAAMWHPGILLMHLFLGIMAFWHHSTSCMCLLSPVTQLFHKSFGTICSMFKQHWLMSTSQVVCTLLQVLLQIYLGSLLYPGLTAVPFLFWVVAYQSIP